MEIGFIAHACRRYFWMVVMGALLGTALGSMLASGGPPEYTSEGLMSVEPPDGVQQSDRYVATQMVILTSSGVTEAVSALPEVGLDPVETRNAVQFTQIAGTDAVSVAATASEPEVAQAIAMGYMNAYFDVLRGRADENQIEQRVALEESISVVETQLAAVDAQVEALTAPYLGSATGIPNIEQLNPALATTRNALTEQYRQLLSARSTFDLSTTNDIGSRLLQEASLPTDPSTSDQPLYIVVGLLLGAVLGVTAATVAARLSPRLIDAGEAEDILRTPFVGAMRRRRRYSASLDDVLFGPEPMQDETIRQLCIRAEAQSFHGESLAILVAGTRPSAGTSTVTALMARLLVEQGNDVLILDADANSPDLTLEIGPESVEPIHDLVFGAGRDGDGPTVIGIDHAGGSLQVVGFDVSIERVPQLSNAPALLAAARTRARIVLIDGGPLMGAASTVQLSRECEAVVLAVPVVRQRVHALRVISGQLGHAQGRLLPVKTPSLRQRKALVSDEAATPDRTLQHA